MVPSVSSTVLLPAGNIADSVPPVAALLNPCDCRRGGKCNCCTSEARAKASTFEFAGAGPATFSANTTITTAPSCTSSCCGPAVPSTSSDCGPSVASTSNCGSKPAGSSSCCAPAPPLTSSYSLPANTYISSAPARPSYTPVTIPRLPNFLFVPSTHYTSSCFCGDSCTCIGCPTHDPQGRKSPNLDHSNESCGCGTAECAGAEAKEEMREGTPGYLRIESTSMSTIDSASSLPSFEELLQRVKGPSLDELVRRVGDNGGYAGVEGTQGGDVRGWNEGGGNPLVEERGCSAMFAEEAYDGGCGDQCTCASNCGCRTGVDAMERNDALSRLAEAAAAVSRAHG